MKTNFSDDSDECTSLYSGDFKVVLKLSSEERKDKRDGNNTMFTDRC